MESPTRQQQQHRIRKRAPNACSRCRQQKIKCSGTAPCGQCSKKNLPCDFNSEHQKILVTRGFLTSLERQAGVSEHGNSRGPERDRVGLRLSIDENYDPYIHAGKSMSLPYGLFPWLTAHGL